MRPSLRNNERKGKGKKGRWRERKIRKGRKQGGDRKKGGRRKEEKKMKEGRSPNTSLEALPHLSLSHCQPQPNHHHFLPGEASCQALAPRLVPPYSTQQPEFLERG